MRLLILFALLFSSQVFTKDFSVRFNPYAQSILSADVDSRSRNGVNILRGDGYGFGLGARLGVSFRSFEGGLDLNHFQLGTDDNGNSSTSLQDKNITARNFGAYIGWRYMNIVTSLSYFFSGRATMSDSASYESDGGGFRIALGYLFQDKYLLSAEYMNMDTFNNGDLSNSNFQLDLQKMISLSFTMPISLLEW